MRAFLKFFARPILKYVGAGVAIQLAAIFLISRISSTETEVVARVIVLWLLAPFGVYLKSAHLIGKNKVWMLSLPISKSKLVGTFYLLHVMLASAVIVGQIAVALVVLLVGHIENPSQPRLQGSVVNPQQEVLDAISFFADGSVLRGDIYSWAYALGVICFFLFIFNIISLFPYGIARTDRKVGITQGIRENKVGHAALLGLLFASQTALWRFFDVKIVYISVIFVAMSSGACNAIAWAFALSRTQRRRYMAIALSSAALQSMLLWGLAYSGTRSQSAEVVADSLHALGPYAPRLTEEKLRSLLSLSSLRFGAAHDLVKAYLEIPAAQRALTPEQAFKNRGLWVSRELYPLYDARSMSWAGVQTIMTNVKKVPDDPRRVARDIARLASAESVGGHLKELLHSKDEIEIAVALLHARYHRKVEWIALIEEAYPAYSDRFKAAALKSLSVLLGRQITEDRNRQLASKVAPTQLTADCAGWNLHSGAEDPGRFNVCLREAALIRGPHAMVEVERNEWWGNPLSANQLASARKILSP